MREVRDALQVVAEGRLALVQDLQQDVARLAGGGRAPVLLLRVHPLVGDAQRERRVARFVRQHHGAVRGLDREALALLGQRRGRQRDDRLGVRRARHHQHAELVAADPVRRARTA